MIELSETSPRSTVELRFNHVRARHAQIVHEELSCQDVVATSQYIPVKWTLGSQMRSSYTLFLVLSQTCNMYTSPSLLLLPFALSITRATPSPPPLIFRDGTLATYKTQNDLTDGSPCKPMTIIFARGTTEPGNVGTITGPPFFAAVSDAVGANNLAVQGVPYPADIPGFLAGGDAGGSATLAKLVQQATTQCPDTKVVMSGYR